MRVNGQPMRTIWWDAALAGVGIIDQTELPHRLATLTLRSVAEVVEAIAVMRVRGAPLIGMAGAYGMALAMQVDASDAALRRDATALARTRPTAVNLAWAVAEVVRTLTPLPASERPAAALRRAHELCEADVANCRAIGEHGLALLRALVPSARQAGRLNLLTHCNAGWLATVDYGTALAPIYLAHDAGLALHVWVDETRPRNQGASLTAWELGQHGVPHTVIVDNAGGHLMQNGLVDACIVGTDRTTNVGDVCNKVGTYLKALAAHDNHVPFYAAVPESSIDWTLAEGVGRIPIEERDPSEVHEVRGRDASGRVVAVRVTPAGSQAGNVAFDVTPARLVSALITERGTCAASRSGLLELFPERAVVVHG